MSDHHLSTTVSPQFQEPPCKMATLHPSSSNATAVGCHLLGFTKLPLPHSFPTASPSPLRRTISEPIYSPGTINSSAPPPQLLEFPTSPALNPSGRIQESTQFQNGATGLQRTISDPNPFLNQQAAAAGSTPPHPTAGRKALMSPSCVESPSAKRLKRMRERLKEMSQWWNEVVSEGDEDETEIVNNCSDNNPKEDSEKCREIPSREDVWIEKNGECLVLHFKCPCSKGYEVLLSGNNCYYKLSDF